jgi:membrane protein DedA with SNARE-associated domain/membrane-associated phospholipid phosphatase
VSAREILAAVAALLVAAYVVWRWRRLSAERKAIGVVVAAALAVYASGVLSELPDPKAVIEDIARALGAWTYALVGLMAYLETGAFVGLVAPGETVVIAGGVIAGQGEIQLLPLIGLVWICAVLGDTTSFFIGRRLGRGFLVRHGPRVKITPERLAHVEAYFQRHGGKTILIGRFIGLVRALAPFVAGSSGLPYRRFIPYSIVGTGLWSATFCVLGYIFWRSFDQVASIAGQAVFGFGLTVGLIVGIVVVYKRRDAIRDWMLAHEHHPLVRPLFALGRPVYRRLVRPVVHAIAPHLHFLWNRVTPGELGLELTIAVAVASAGIFIFVMYLVVLADNPGPTPLDTELLDAADAMRSQVVVDVAKVVSALGAFATVATLLAVAVVVLAVRGRVAELVVLLAGVGLIYAAVDIAKAAVDRPRPAGPLIETAASSYPSGHAAYATAWIAVAVVVTRRLGLAGHAAIVVAGIAIAAAVGVSRIYLRAHYWSDIAGGWALGAGIFGLLTAIALIVNYIRHNGGKREPEPWAAPPEREARRDPVSRTGR